MKTRSMHKKKVLAITTIKNDEPNRWCNQLKAAA